jgi:hypothetical protein
MVQSFAARASPAQQRENKRIRELENAAVRSRFPFISKSILLFSNSLILFFISFSLFLFREPDEIKILVMDFLGVGGVTNHTIG